MLTEKCKPIQLEDLKMICGGGCVPRELIWIETIPVYPYTANSVRLELVNYILAIQCVEGGRDLLNVFLNLYSKV